MLYVVLCIAYSVDNDIKARYDRLLTSFGEEREMKMLLSITRSSVVSVRGGGSYSSWRLG